MKYDSMPLYFFITKSDFTSLFLSIFIDKLFWNQRFMDTKCPHTYEEPGKYQVLVKVMDIFGNDTNKLLEIEV